MGVIRLSADSSSHPFSQFTAYMIVSRGWETIGVTLFTVECDKRLAAYFAVSKLTFKLGT